MGTLIAFPEQTIRQPKRQARTEGSVTLFLHVRCTTLIAHLARRPRAMDTREERISKN